MPVGDPEGQIVRIGEITRGLDHEDAAAGLAEQGWPGGLRWLHGEEDEPGGMIEFLNCP
ncbi:MAG: hypothetical protein J4F39_18680 [Candidatus Latescibacteria bacterium]|nr:hypothetical protein [Candidatus Latescibacterota bacterium]